MVTKLQKEETVTELKDKFSKACAVYSTEQSGLSVAEITDLRGKLREVESEYKIAKNTLMSIAAKGTDFEPITEGLAGPTALLFCYGDATAPAGVLKKFTKDVPDKIEFKAGILDGELLDKDRTIAVAGLPSKEVLYSQVAGLLVGSLSGMAYILQELGNKDDKDKQLKDFAADAPAPEAKEEPKDEPKAEESKEETKAEEPAATEEKPEENKEG